VLLQQVPAQHKFKIKPSTENHRISLYIFLPTLDTMKNLHLSTLLFFAVSVLLMSGCEDDPVTPPTATHHTVHVGDWSRYEHFLLDSSNQIITSTRFLKSRTVAATGLTAFGSTGVFKTIDSVFNQNGTLKGLDSTFFKMSGGKLYVYNFARVLAAAVPSQLGFKPVATWIAVASTDSSAANLAITDSLFLENSSGGTQAFMMQGSASGGASMTNTAQATYSTVKTDWNVSTNISGTTVDIPIEFYVGKGNTTSSPLTIIGMKVSGFSVAGVSVQGQRYNLLEFKSGH
jgi:hypothetical protein